MKLFAFMCFISLSIIGCNPESKKSENKSSLPLAKEVKKSFDYQPQKPVNGQLKAVIELGSLGLNYFIVNIDDNGRWELKKSNYGRSNIIYGANTSKEVISNIISFQTEIIDYGVELENIYLIVSSSVVKTEDITGLETKMTKNNLPLVSVSLEKEAQLAMAATIPKEFLEESFLVDIGSGNTKFSWVENQDTLSIETHGSKYFLNDIQDTTVFRQVRDAILEIPKRKRNLCFMLGGIIYEMAKVDIENSSERYHVLKSPDLYTSDNEKLKAGKVIYNALHLEPTYSYIFDTQSNFSIGYLVGLNQ
ncbi:hypothetical protein [Ekhidna sp.]